MDGKETKRPQLPRALSSPHSTHPRGSLASRQDAARSRRGLGGRRAHPIRVHGDFDLWQKGHHDEQSGLKTRQVW